MEKWRLNCKCETSTLQLVSLSLSLSLSNKILKQCLEHQVNIWGPAIYF